MKLGFSLPERLQKFKDLASDKQGNAISKWDIPTSSGTELREVYKVSVELPKYRLDNTRTLALQEQFVYSNNYDEDFFDDVESEKVQEVQHNLLKELIKSSDKEKDLLTYFSDTSQTEPLILTHDGFVISGNRRLCAFRELLTDDYDKYKRFSEVRVVVLPNLDADKIDQIEDYLEQQKDIKEPFSWVSRALGYRRRMHRYNYSDDDLAAIAGLKKTEISSLINKLEIADRYLDSIGRPKDYNQILDDYYAFEKIYACQQKDKSGSVVKKVAFEKLAFLAVKNKDSFSDRMYKNIPIIHKVQDEIESEITIEFEEEIKENEKLTDKKSKLANLGLFPEQSVGVISVLDNAQNEERLVVILSDKIEEHLALERERKKRTSVLDRVRKVNTLLIEANALKSDETDTKGVLAQIMNIEKELTRLKTWASKE